MDNEFCIVLTTVNNRQNGKAIIDAALSHKLAACIQTMAIESHYVWQDEVCCDDELLLIIKSRNACYQELEQLIVALHEYEVPQVVQVPFVKGYNPYLSWLESNTKR